MSKLFGGIVGEKARKFKQKTRLEPREEPFLRFSRVLSGLSLIFCLSQGFIFYECYKITKLDENTLQNRIFLVY